MGQTRRPILAIAVLALAGGAADAEQGLFSYTRPATFESIETTIQVPTRDGTKLACDLYRPGTNGLPAPGRFPGIIHEYTPYGPPTDPRMTVGESTLGTNAARIFSTRGYVVLTCSIRGTWTSEGTWPGWFSDVEVEDNYDLVEWMAAQEWSDGRIGQEGQSYGGVTTLRVAAKRPPHLVAIAPQQAFADAYLDYFYPGGIRADVTGWSAFLLPVSAGARGGEDQLVTWASHPLSDEYWRQVSVESVWDRITVPTLIFGGWFDYMRRGNVRNYQGLGRNAWLIDGPWLHDLVFDDFWGPGDGSFGSSEAGMTGSRSFAHLSPSTLLAWFDHWLKELPDVPLPPARVVAYELPEHGGRGWQQLADFPPPDAMRKRLYLRSDLRLARRPGPPGIRSYGVQPFDGPATICFPPLTTRMDPTLTSPTALPCDPQRDMRYFDAERLAFTGAPLGEDLVLAGTPVVHLVGSLTARDGNLVAKLEDVAPDGTVLEATVGYLKASHRLSHSTLSPIVPGRTYEFSFPMEPMYWRFQAGHRVRISLTSGDYPRISPDAEPGVVTIATGDGGSAVEFPARGGGAPLPRRGASASLLEVRRHR